MKVLGLAAIATALACFSWVVQAKQANNLENPGGGPASVTGTLVPGGTLVGPDDVSIRTINGPLYESIQVMVERLASSSLSIPLPSEFELIGPAYRISISGKPTNGPGSIYIDYPLPLSSRVEDIRVAVLLPRGATIADPQEPSSQLVWDISTNSTLDVQNRKITDETALPDSEGWVFALVRRISPSTQGLNYLNSSVQVQQLSSGFLVVCDPDFPPKILFHKLQMVSFLWL